MKTNIFFRISIYFFRIKCVTIDISNCNNCITLHDINTFKVEIDWIKQVLNMAHFDHYLQITTVRVVGSRRRT